MSTKTRKPNVIIINVDDVGYGATKVRTSNIGRLAEEGRKFTDAHSASAVCSPSRYPLITGEYPARIYFWSPIFERDTLMVDPLQTTVAEVMKEANYAVEEMKKGNL